MDTESLREAPFARNTRWSTSGREGLFAYDERVLQAGKLCRRRAFTEAHSKSNSLQKRWAPDSDEMFLVA